ncbi:MAG: M28 family peptidase [Flammeovirgaceae bacterium]
MIRVAALLFSAIVMVSCGSNKPKEEEKQIRVVNVPKFSGDTAYYFVAQQVRFGPRVPNTPSHVNAGNYLVARLKQYGANVTEQNFEATTFDNQRLRLRNIIASYNSEAKKRVLLAAHWDTRPFADKDQKKKDFPFDGANDGASGVAVLMEVARHLGSEWKPTVGVDIIFFDGEDWGERNGETPPKLPAGQASWWCIGSQYWAKNKHLKNYSAHYGILLDMVGADRSQFYREDVSLEYAGQTVKKVWDMAAKVGYSDYFVNQNVEGITDDHLFVNQIAKIPMIDIVHYQAGVGFFGDYHHTTKDNLNIISKQTLTAVGSTLLNVVYYEY